MKSHFTLNSKAAMACAVAGASTMMMNGNCTAQTVIAADYATNSTYAAGWSAGQSGGYGFGPWSFDGTNTNPPTGPYQGISTTSPLGTSWTLLTYDPHSGLADAGRAIAEPGGLQPGQTLEMVVDNPTGYHFYRGFDICCLNGTNNNPGGVNTAAIRTQVFAYGVTDWEIVDDSGTTTTPLDLGATGSAGMKFDLTLTSTNTYILTLTPLSNPSSAYTQNGTLTTNLPINYINFRQYWGVSGGLTDTTNNFEMSSITITGPPPFVLNIQKVGANVILSWPTNYPTAFVESTINLGSATVWNTNSIMPVIINRQNVVTNPITGAQQYYRLQD